MENKIITRTTNVVDFEVSKESYNRAKKKIEDVGKSWEKVDQKVKSASRHSLRIIKLSSRQITWRQNV